MSITERTAAQQRVSTALAQLDEGQLDQLLAGSPVTGSGIGGTNALPTVDGVQVFAKRVALTERDLAHPLSTANLFDLPAYCQWGVGSPGFGAWRELAAHLTTTDWVLGGRCQNFPLLYHWRVLPTAGPVSDELADVGRMVEHWHGSPAVRDYMIAILTAPASLILFLEYIPNNLHNWFAERFKDEAACAMVERDLRSAVAFMNSNGLFHFDAHFANILTDGERLYLSDFGLATSPTFELSADERAFLAAAERHDECYVVTHLVSSLVTGFNDVRGKPAERNDLVRRYAEGTGPDTLSPTAAAIVERYAPIAVVFNDLYWKLHGEDRRTPYPLDDVRRACAEVGL